MDPIIFAVMDARLRIRGVFTRERIEEVLAEIYTIGTDVPTVCDDEFHCMITEAAAHYMRLGLLADPD